MILVSSAVVAALGVVLVASSSGRSPYSAPCGGLMLLDDKDQHTLAALRVAPIPPMTYPLYRAAMITAVTTVSITAALALTLQVPAELVLKSVRIGYR